jgi:hypothetical protein
MIPIDKLKAVKTIIVHDNCSDGLMSAILLKDAYSQIGLEPELKFVQYGTEDYKKLEPGPNMMFCDFSPNIKTVKQPDGSFLVDESDRPRLQAWVDAGTLILDHHKGAKDVVAGFGDNGVFGDEVTMPGVSGAWLAFREVWMPFYKGMTRGAWAEKFMAQEPTFIRATTLEELAKQLDDDLAGNKDEHDVVVDSQDSEVGWAGNLAMLAGIRDTWQNHHARWREACILNEVLRFYPNEEWLGMVVPFHPGNRGFWTERLKLGDLLWTKHEKSIKKCIEKSWRFTSDKGTRVLIFEGVRNSSDVAEAIDTEADLIIGFDYEAETPKDGGATVRKIIYSTRSHTNFNCMEFAKAFGGGGHTKAAGFNVQFDRDAPPNSLSRYAYTLNPYTLAETLVRMHEEKQQGT